MSLAMSYLKEDVTIQRVALSKYNEPVKTPTATKGRHKKNIKRVNNRDGEEVTSMGSVLLAPDEPVGFDDFIVVDGVDRKVLAIKEVKGFRLVRMKEVFVA